MGALSKEEKRALMQKWKEEQNRKFLLNKTRAKKLFAYLRKKLREEPCDHSLRYTQEWILQNCSNEEKDGVLNEIREMGGYCDCEVLLNCYERYEI